MIEFWGWGKMRNKLNKIVSYIVIICFIYLIIFENKFNLDLFIIEKFKCETEEVIYFKCVILVVIYLLIMNIKQIVDKYAINIDMPLKSYITIHPIRSFILFIIILTFILISSMIILGMSNILFYIIPIILIGFSGMIGFYIGVIKKE